MCVKCCFVYMFWIPTESPCAVEGLCVEQWVCLAGGSGHWGCRAERQWVYRARGFGQRGYRAWGCRAMGVSGRMCVGQGVLLSGPLTFWDYDFLGLVWLVSVWATGGLLEAPPTVSIPGHRLVGHSVLQSSNPPPSFLQIYDI